MWGKRILTVASLAAVASLGITACEQQAGQTGQQDQQNQQDQAEDQQPDTGETYGTDVPGQTGQQPEDTGQSPSETGQQPEDGTTEQPGTMDEPGAGEQPDQALNTMVQQIEDDLQGRPELQGELEQVEITTEGNQVLLSGTVSSQQVADQIEQAASEIAGTDRIRNDLTVGEDQSP